MYALQECLHHVCHYITLIRLSNHIPLRITIACRTLRNVVDSKFFYEQVTDKDANVSCVRLVREMSGVGLVLHFCSFRSIRPVQLKYDDDFLIF